jgi:hypothetical protein
MALHASQPARVVQSVSTRQRWACSWLRLCCARASRLSREARRAVQAAPHAQPNPESGAVVRQLPAEETLRIARAVECVQSMLVNQRG